MKQKVRLLLLTLIVGLLMAIVPGSVLAAPAVGGPSHAQGGSSPSDKQICFSYDYSCDHTGYYGQSTWGFPGGHNCTNYAAWRLSLNGVPQPNYNLGNGGQWAVNARNHGVLVNGTPAVGSIAEWDPWTHWANNQYGHVGYVYAVGSNYIDVIADNSEGYMTDFQFNTGSLNWPSNFIHFKDIGGSSAALASVSMSPGTENVYAIGDDGNVYYQYWANNSWSGWYSLGAPTPGVSSNTSLAAASMSTNTMNVYVIGGDHQVYNKYWANNSWSAWTSMGGSWTVHGALASVSMSPGTENVYAIGDAGQVYYQYWANNSWSGWYSLGAPIPGVSSNTSLAAASMSTKTENVYVIGGDHQVYNKYWANNSWSAWTSMGGSWTVHGALAAASMSPGTENVYAIGDAGQVYYQYWANNSWSGWYSLGAPIPGVSSNTSLAAASMSTKTENVYVIGGDHQVYNKYWANNSWSAWTSMGPY